MSTAKKIGPEFMTGYAGLFFDLINPRQRNGLLRPSGSRRFVDINQPSKVGKAEALIPEKRCEVDFHIAIVAQLTTEVKRQVAQYANDSISGPNYCAAWP